MYFIDITNIDNNVLSLGGFSFDKNIPLPAQKKDFDSPGNFDMAALCEEQILSAIIELLSMWYKNTGDNLIVTPDSNPTNTNILSGEKVTITKSTIDYYAKLLKAVRPNIIKQLGTAAVAKARNNDFKMAEDLTSALLVLDPNNMAVILNYALLLDQKADALRLKGLTSDADVADAAAQDFYKTVMNSEPAISEGFFNAGFFFLKKHKYTDALDAFETYIALVCDVSDKDAGDTGLYRRTRAQEIINNIKRDGLADVDFQQSYQLIDKSNEDSTAIEKGLDYARKFLQKSPKSARGWFLTGWGLRKLKRWSDSKSAFLQSLKCDSDDNELRCNTYNELAICLIETGELGDAKKMLEKALSLDTENIKVISNLAVVAQKEGNIPLAQKYYTAVLEYNKDDPLALLALSKLELSN